MHAAGDEGVEGEVDDPHAEARAGDPGPNPYRSVTYDYRGRSTAETNATGQTTRTTWDIRDLEVATEFLVLIAALLELKSRLMLPREDDELPDFEPGGLFFTMFSTRARAVRRASSVGGAPRGTCIEAAAVGSDGARAGRGLAGEPRRAPVGARHFRLSRRLADDPRGAGPNRGPARRRPTA